MIVSRREQRFHSHRCGVSERSRFIRLSGHLTDVSCDFPLRHDYDILRRYGKNRNARVCRGGGVSVYRRIRCALRALSCLGARNHSCGPRRSWIGRSLLPRVPTPASSDGRPGRLLGKRQLAWSRADRATPVQLPLCLLPAVSVSPAGGPPGLRASSFSESDAIKT